MISSESRMLEIGHVRFDERGEEPRLSERLRHRQAALAACESGRQQLLPHAKASAPLLDSTFCLDSLERTPDLHCTKVLGATTTCDAPPRSVADPSRPRKERAPTGA